MRVRVHESGRQRRVAEVEHFGIRRNRRFGTGPDNLTAAHDNHARSQHALAVKDPPGFEHQSLGGCERASRNQQATEQNAFHDPTSVTQAAEAHALLRQEFVLGITARYVRGQALISPQNMVQLCLRKLTISALCRAGWALVWRKDNAADPRG